MLPSHSRPIEHPSAVTAAAATLWTLGVPAVTLILLLAATGRHAPALLAGVITVGASLGAMAVGSRWWRTRPESQSLSFAQLMMWTWFRRARALRTLERTLQLLEGGSPVHQLQVLRQLSSALETKDRYTHGHSRRVERHAIRTAMELDSTISQEEIEDVALSAALHDVGKIEIPDSILQKEGALTPREQSIVKWHTVVGARLVAKTGNRRVAQAVLHHHESWDGTGYPHGLRGEEIPLYARIIAVSDAFDAMTSSRPYRSSLGRARAVQVLKSETGRQFDPRVVEAFLRSLPTHASVAIMVPGVAHAMRQIGGWARRIGLASTAPGTAGVVVAAVVGTAVLSLPPSPVAQPSPSESDGKAETAMTDSGTSGAVASGAARHRGTGETNGRAHRLSALVAGGAEPLATATDPLTPVDSGPVDRGVPGQNAPGTDPVPPSGTEPTPPPGQEPAPAPSPEPSPPSAPSNEPDDGGDGGGSDGGGSDGGGSDGGGSDSGKGKPGGGDPQPDKGKDCEQPPPSKGNGKHCGGD
jgi:uncharacterized membrane protein YgcG